MKTPASRPGFLFDRQQRTTAAINFVCCSRIKGAAKIIERQGKATNSAILQRSTDTTFG
jgi:hypothetical protein